MRWTASQHAIEQRPQGINVPSCIGNRLEVGLLRGHIEERPQRGNLLVRETRLAEIRQPRSPVLIQQHVGRLHIAMQYSLAVSVDQAHRHVVEQRDGLGHRNRPLLETLGQGPPFEVLHDVIRRIGVPADPEQLDDVPIGEQEG